MSDAALNKELLTFLQKSPTPFHAVQTMAGHLRAAGFTELDENRDWSLQPGSGYFYHRGGSSIVAFRTGLSEPATVGLRLIGAHTDSPCLKVKPEPDMQRNGYQMLGVEVYGGALLAPWFDRDLSLAGKVVYRDDRGQLQSTLLDFGRPTAVVPNLAIHLNRTANEGQKINPQQEMNALLLQSEEQGDFRQLLKSELERQQLCDNGVQDILDFNISFYDTQPPALTGLNSDFISSARLDNLLSCYLGLRALVDADTQQTCILICNDHEEVGSRSDIGAQGPLLTDLLQRLLPEPGTRLRALRRSLMVSVDNAHGIHPNYASRHDDNHEPQINGGPVLKYDANQSYATSSDTAACIRWLAGQGAEPVPLQSYVTRADMRCGSTIGPLSAAETGMRTVDLGLATFAMHSVRELGGARDSRHMHQLLKRFCEADELPTP